MKKKISTVAIVALILCVLIIGVYRQVAFSGQFGRDEAGQLGSASTGQQELLRLTSLEEFYALENAFVYVGSDVSTECNIFRPILKEVMQEEHLTVYYFDTDYFRNVLGVAEGTLQRLLAEYKILAVPAVIELENGQLEAVTGISSLGDTAAESLKLSLQSFFAGEELINDTIYPEDSGLLYAMQIILLGTSVFLFILVISAALFARKTTLVQREHFLLIIMTISIALIIATSIAFFSAMNYVMTHNMSGNAYFGSMQAVTFFLGWGSFVVAVIWQIKRRRLLNGDRDEKHTFDNRI